MWVGALWFWSPVTSDSSFSLSLPQVRAQTCSFLQIAPSSWWLTTGAPPSSSQGTLLQRVTDTLCPAHPWLSLKGNYKELMCRGPLGLGFSMCLLPYFNELGYVFKKSLIKLNNMHDVKIKPKPRCGATHPVLWWLRRWELEPAWPM